MIIRSVNLETVCGITSRLPEHDKPEFAFAGRSNVGKSSLINGIMNRSSYARTSGNPGKTQTVNFYNINDEFYLVDLPGYGYATAGLEERAKWGPMIERYLKKSPSLKAVFLLTDIRREPSDEDVMMFDWIVRAGFEPVVIATKSDKIKRSQLKKQTDLLRSSYESRAERKVNFRILPYSALTKAGREEIYSLLDELCGTVTQTGEV